MFALEAREDLLGNAAMDCDGVGVFGLGLGAVGFPIGTVEVVLKVVVLELRKALLVEGSCSWCHTAKDLV